MIEVDEINSIRWDFDRQADLLPGDAVSKEAQLLLLLVRGVRSDETRSLIDAIVAHGVNWNALLLGAQMNMVGCLVCAGLEPWFAAVPADVLTVMQALRRAHAVRLLQLRAREEGLRREHLEKLGATYAFVKGRHLGKLLYESDLIRHYRDIDVMLEPAAISQLVKRLVAQGYSITNSEYVNGRVKSIAALSRYFSAVELVAPDGIPVELHSRLDNSGCVFRTRLGRNRGWVSLDDATHLCYMYYHHARHKWSMLHWCADLFAVIENRRFKGMELTSAARAGGLDTTIVESNKFASDLALIAVTGRLPFKPESRFFWDAWRGICFSTAGDSDRLKSLFGESEREPDFHYKWQRSIKYSLRSALSRLRPTINDYLVAPGLDSYPFVYWLIRPFSVAARRLRRDRSTANS